MSPLSDLDRRILELTRQALAEDHAVGFDLPTYIGTRMGEKADTIELKLKTLVQGGSLEAEEVAGDEGAKVVGLTPQGEQDLAS